MSAHDPSSSITTHLLAAMNEMLATINEMQLRQQKTERELEEEKAKSRQVQKNLNASGHARAHLEEDLHLKQIGAAEQPTSAPAQISKHTTVQQTSSENDIASKSSSTGCKTAEASVPSTIIPLESFHSEYRSLVGRGLRILYSPKGDELRFIDDAHPNGATVMLNNGQIRIFSGSKSFPPTVLIVRNVELVLCLRFPTEDYHNLFLRTARRVNDTARFYDLEFNDYDRVFKAVRLRLRPVLAVICDQLDQNRSDSVIKTFFKRLPKMNTDEDLPPMLRGASDHANNTIRLESRTVGDYTDKVSTQSNTDASNLSSNLDRLRREMVTLDEKHKSAMNEVKTRSSANSEDLNHIDGLYKSVEKDLMLKASSLEREAAVLNDKIVQLTSHVITVNASLNKKSEDGRTQSTTERAAGKRKRDVQDTGE